MEVQKLEKEKEVQQLSFGEESVYSKAPRFKKYIATIAIYYCTFSFGVGGGVTLLGPCMVEFSHKFQKDVSQVSIVFTILIAAYATGSLTTGVVTKFINRQMVVIVLLSIGSAVLFTIPHVSAITPFFILAGFLGFFAGGYDTAQTAWMIDIWRHESPPFILTQHFMYALGSIVPPLLLSPFLKGQVSYSGLTNITTSNMAGNFSSNSNSTEHHVDEMESEARLWIPYSIAGCIVVSAIIVQIGCYFAFRRSSTSTDVEINTSAEAGAKSPITSFKLNWKSICKFEFPERRQIILVTLSCCCTGAYQGMEVCTMQFLPTFAQFSKVHFSESEGANLLFGLTLNYCICRLAGIFIVLKAQPQFILLGNFVLLIIANLILVLFAGGSREWMWAGSVLIGAALSTVFPAFFAYMEKYLFISDRIASILLVCGGIMAAIYPITVGNFVEMEPRVLIFANLFSVCVFISSFGGIYWLTHVKGSKQK